MNTHEAIKILRNTAWLGTNEDREKAEQAIEVVAEALAKEPICCKDCKYWQDNNNGYPVMDCRWNKDETPDADDYCSYAERK